MQKGEALNGLTHRAQEAEAIRFESVRLFRLTEAINRAIVMEDIYAPALDAVCDLVGADRAAILLFDPDGVVRFKAWRGLSSGYRAAVEGHSPWKREDAQAEPIVVPDVMGDASLARYQPLFAEEEIGALAFVPLLHARELLGKFVVYFPGPRPLDPRDVQLAQTVAALVAQAVVRARLLETERRARREAEDAVRARDEILRIVTHDLRNPLGVVMVAATQMIRHDLPTAERRVALGETIQRAAERMEQLLRDLVDLASLQEGRLSVEVRPVSAPDVVTAALEQFAALAETKGVGLSARIPDSLALVAADFHRTVQALSNLLSNAVKVLPKGGAIDVRVRDDGKFARFSVVDTGPGIPADELARIFERYWRSPKAPYAGTGLGLSIVRGIVEAQGGTIWAESEPGRGATFHFTLPFAPVEADS